MFRLSHPTPDIYMCCICFRMWHVDELYVDASGVKWDMCPKCGEREAAILEEHLGGAASTGTGSGDSDPLTG